MFTILGVLAVVVPIVELILLAVVADHIGILPTLLLLVLLTGAGFWLLIKEGISTWRRLRAAIRNREAPSEDLGDAVVLLCGAVLLVTPGFMTDVAALFFLLPKSRRVLRRGAMRILRGLAVSRLGWVGRGGKVARRVYDARVTGVRRTDTSEVRSPLPIEAPAPLPSSERRDDEGDSPDTG
ncbi:MAG TPA: FxsA family protein [Actinomycetota bacterium]|nr:FxsA family protein [Actinomycetota bacterium]